MVLETSGIINLQKESRQRAALRVSLAIPDVIIGVLLAAKNSNQYDPWNLWILGGETVSSYFCRLFV